MSAVRRTCDPTVRGVDLGAAGDGYPSTSAATEEERMGEDDDQFHVVEIAALLRELTAGLVGSASLDDALAVLVSTVARVVPGGSWCAITVLRAGAPSTRAVSGTMPAQLDEVQYLAGDGPALAAIRGREMVVVDDLA